MVSFSLTYCVLLVRKSKIQAMRFLFTERDKSFSTIICGWMVLNADEKSMNRMRTNLFGLFICFRALFTNTRTASFTPRLVLYANCKGSSLSSTSLFSSFNTNRSKHFIIIGVIATGRRLFISVNIGFFGTGIISAVFHVVGMLLCLRERLKRVVKIPASSQQLLKTFPHILSCPLALCTFSPLKDRHTSLSFTSI